MIVNGYENSALIIKTRILRDERERESNFLRVSMFSEMDGDELDIWRVDRRIAHSLVRSVDSWLDSADCLDSWLEDAFVDRRDETSAGDPPCSGCLPVGRWHLVFKTSTRVQTKHFPVSRFSSG